VAAGEEGVRLWIWRSDDELRDELTRRLRDRQFTPVECELYSIPSCG
jgi:hypothetical protein